MNSALPPLLWHGSSGPGEPDSSRPVWLTGDPSVAAIHSGASGTVHAFSMRPGTRLLRAIETDGDVPESDRPDAEVWRRILALMDGTGLDGRGLPCLDEDRVERFMSPPLGPDGQPTWWSLVRDMRDEFGEASLDLFSNLGFDGVAIEERMIGVLHSRRDVVHGSGDPAYARFVASHSGFARKTLSVSVRIASGVELDHAGRFEPLAVAWTFGSEHRPRRVTPEEEIRAFFVAPSPEAGGPGFG